jgi:putative ABC transport system permease protein
MNLVVRASANPGLLGTALYDAVRAIDKDETLSALKSMDYIVESSVAQPRFSSLQLGLFAGLALILSAVGLYGVTAYSVAQRTNEIGIRMALGANQAEVLKLVVIGGMKMAALGLSLGLAGSFVFGRFLASMLYDVKPGDPLTLGLVSVGLAGVALLATYIPARRACKVDPMVALRYE